MSRTSRTSAPEQAGWGPGRVIGTTVTILLVAVLFYLIYRFFSVLFVLFVAIVLATAIRPAVLWLERRHIPPQIGVLLVFLVIGLVTLAILSVLAPLLITQATDLVASFPSYYTQGVAELRTSGNPILRFIAAQAPQQLQFDAAIGPRAIRLETVAQAAGYIRSLAWGIFAFIAMLLVSYFWILDRERIVHATLLLFPTEQRDTARAMWDTLETKVGAFVRGQALLCLSIGIASAIAFFAIGVPNALLLAVLAGLFEVIPYVGPLLTGVIAGIVTLAQAPDKIWWVLGAFIVIQQLENSVLVPRIMDKTVGVNPVVVLLAIVAFGILLGVAGAIMAIPLTVIVQILFRQWVTQVQQAPSKQIIGRDRTAVLRYQAQELAHDLRTRVREHPDQLGTKPLEEQLEAIVSELDTLIQTASKQGPAGTEPPQR